MDNITRLLGNIRWLIALLALLILLFLSIPGEWLVDIVNTVSP